MRVLGPFDVAGQFDGLRAEASGNLLASSWQGVVVISPDGKIADQVSVDGKSVISATFCGPDLRDVVCMVNGASPASGFMMRLSWPRPGLRLVYG
jgi:sugar lactone lactonase YvrE